MIYITGDCYADFSRFLIEKFPIQSEMTKDDYIIICGDFGGVWTFEEESSREKEALDWLNNKNFTTLFVDGNHENYTRLYNYPIEEWKGGKVAKEAMLATRRDDIRLVEDSKKWIQDPKHKASRREKEYAIKRLDGLIQKIETAMEKIVIRITSQLKQLEKKKAVVEEIKKEVKPSIREKLALNVAKIQREEAERKQLKKGKSHSSDLEM